MNALTSPLPPRRPESRRRADRQLRVRAVDAARGCGADAAARSTPAKPLDADEVDSFLAIHADGIGHRLHQQGRCRHGSAHRRRADGGRRARHARRAHHGCRRRHGLCPDQGGTGGSTGLTRGGTGDPPRGGDRAPGAARAGRRALSRPASESDHRRRPGAADRRRRGRRHRRRSSAARRFAIKVDAMAPLAAPARYTVVGKPMPRPDVADKCTARHVYVQDVSLPGMLHGRVIRPPAIGAKLMSVDESSVFGDPGRTRRPHRAIFSRVVAKDEWAAVRAATALKATWSDVGRRCPAATASSGTCATARSIAIESVVEPRRCDRGAGRRGEEDIRDVLLAESEPRVARPLVRRRRRSARRQRRSGPRRRARMACGRIWPRSSACRSDKMRVVFLEGSGSYGTNGSDYVAADAVLLSKSVGQPVRVQWMRQDEHRLGSEGPAAADRPARRHRRRRRHRRLGRADVGADDEAGGAGAAGGRTRRASRRSTGRTPGPLTQNGDPPYEAANVARRRALAEGHAARAVESARAGQDRQRVRGRELHRRARRGRRRGSAGIPPARS